MTEPDVETSFATNMKALREAMGWNQNEMARRLSGAGLEGFHQTTVSRIEQGQRPVRLAEATVIARILRTSLDRLAGDAASVAALAGTRQAIYEAEANRVRVADAWWKFRGAVTELARRLGADDPDVDVDAPASFPGMSMLDPTDRRIALELLTMSPGEAAESAPF